MRVGLFLDEVEQSIQNRTTRQVPIDRDDLLQMAERALSDLAVGGEWDWSKVWLSPMIQTVTGVKDYSLPDDFPENFVRGGQDTGQGYLCKLSDGTNESPLTHKGHEQYFSQNLTGASNGRPSNYTVRRDAGAAVLSVFPPPDSNSDSNYTILGLYVPTYWKFESEDDLIPAGAVIRPYLRESVLAMWYLGRNAAQLKEHQIMASEQLAALRFRQARARRSRAMPKLSESGTYNANSQMGR